ncbi:hypothetical protein RD110_00740 [Rhodoferax koreense]|uniref:Uncharacterized protein n=1 Tax=Rhodoferax koreensis TaxID=1842727 RepID=A0A1P8JQA8_9BURK|nr:hypothetical protein [Rhodoferax koreense]APW35918.1 hypothetical protein RD110_00740 [Rhodoferax koreense]
MTSFVHTTYSNVHPGVARAESVFSAASRLRRGFDSTKGLSTVLLAAVASALIVAADRMVDSFASDSMTAWILLWVVGFAAIALFAGVARKVASVTVKSLDAWSFRVAQARADERLWNTAQNDPRVMADLKAAIERSEVSAPAIAVAAPKQTFSASKALAQWRADAARARADARLWAVAQRDSRVMDDLMAAQSRAEVETQQTLPAETQTLIKADNAASLREALFALRPKFAYYV